MSTYPVLLGAVVINSTNNKIRWNEAGVVYDATIASGTYYVLEDATTSDLLKAIKTAIEAASASTNTYSVSSFLSMDRASAHSNIRIQRLTGADTFGLIKDGSQTFDYSLIGFTASTAVDSSTKSSTVACGAIWCSNDGFSLIQRSSKRMVGETKTASGRVQQVYRSDRTYEYDLDLVFVDDGRVFIDTPNAHVNDTLEQFMETFGAGAQFRLYLASISSGTTLTDSGASTLIGTMVFSADTLSDFNPQQIGVGMALYDISLKLFKVV